MDQKQQIILFDGVCNLCNGFVQFVINHDPTAKFKFASLQSEAAEKLIEGFQLPPSRPDSIMLIQNKQLYLESTAALRILRQLTGIWPVLYAGMLLPAFVRDAVYKIIARNRYRWFGRQESCMLPSPSLKSRFL
jgi:predicted DCC family thiol-disulfide oxidoreductase YuxK